MKKITILGSTGTIGKQTLEVISGHLDVFDVHAITGFSNVDLLMKQCITYRPRYVVVGDVNSAKKLRTALQDISLSIEVLHGQSGYCEVARLDEVDIVVAAIVGLAGLQSVFAAIQASKTILLANKEALVVSGELFVSDVEKYKATILPLDSEHNAIFQSLSAGYQQNLFFAVPQDYGVKRFILTGSGGPFLNKPLSEFKDIRVEEACAHPNWHMGRKISVDSATMMNKGLEFIELMYLFNTSFEDIEIVIHPQSIVHSLVEYNDGSLISQMSLSDMKVPISYCLFYPNRTYQCQKSLSLYGLQCSFERVDFQRYPCLLLALEVAKTKKSLSVVLNAVNEVAVSAFLQERILFSDIFLVCEKMIIQEDVKNMHSLEMVMELDRKVRRKTQEYIESLERRVCQISY